MSGIIRQFSELGQIPMKSVTGHCETHGDYTVDVLVQGGVARDPHCQRCLDAELARESQAQARDFRERQENGRVKNIDLPSRMIGKRFADYWSPNSKAAQHCETCEAFATNWPAKKSTGSNLILIGKPGTGKTMLASIICEHLAREWNCQPLYTTASRLLRYVRGAYGSGAQYTELQAVERFSLCDLLVVDELGVKNASDHDRSMLFEIVDERYQRQAPSIVISNLAISRIEDQTDARLVDRLAENGTLMAFDWESHRRAPKPATVDRKASA